MENNYHLRKVADSAAKACMICYKPSSSVLITPDSRDFFYVCPSHLKDSNFCQPSESEAAALAERKKKEDLDREVEKIKQEYEAKMKKKEEKQKANKDKKDDKEKETKKAEQGGDAQDEKEKDEKIKALTTKQDIQGGSQVENGPRIFTLKKHFYQMRVEKMRNAEIAKRNRERLRNPTLFPSVPTGNP